MPYLIHAPGSSRAYVTNNPIIFMDCRSWGWDVESRRYADKECRSITDRENKYGLGDLRERELQKFWSGELLKRKEEVEVNVKVEAGDVVVAKSRGEEVGDSDVGVEQKIGLVVVEVRVRAIEEGDVPRVL